MKPERVKLLVVICLLALAGSFAFSLAAGSHFHLTFGEGSFNFDFGIGTSSTPAAVALGFIAVLAFLGALFSGFSGGNPPGPNPPAPPGGPVEGDATNRVMTSVSQTLSEFGGFLRRLAKSRKDVWLGGVCGGLGEQTPVPSWVWRMLFLILIFCYGTGVAAYIILWICLPEAPKEPEASKQPEPPKPSEAAKAGA